MATETAILSRPFAVRPEAFPRLTPAQMERMAARGRRRFVAQGEVLTEAGEPAARMFVVATAHVDIMRPDEPTVMVGLNEPGMFSGEVNLLAGRRSLVHIRVAEAGEIIEVDRDALLAIIQTDSDLSDVLMRAFILRRVELLANGSRTSF